MCEDHCPACGKLIKREDNWDHFMKHQWVEASKLSMALAFAIAFLPLLLACGVAYTLFTFGRKALTSNQQHKLLDPAKASETSLLAEKLNFNPNAYSYGIYR